AKLAGNLAMLQREHAVHENIFNPCRGAVGIFKCSHVVNGFGIKDSYVGKIIRTQQAAIVEAHTLRRQRGEFTDSLLQRQYFLIANILAKNARKSSVASWMRLRFAQQALRIHRAVIVVHPHKWLLQSKAYV